MATSADPGAAPPIHEPPAVRLPPVPLLVMEAAHVAGTLEPSNKMQRDKERTDILFFISLGL
jgi:hypothetical protein